MDQTKKIKITNACKFIAGCAAGATMELGVLILSNKCSKNPIVQSLVGLTGTLGIILYLAEPVGAKIDSLVDKVAGIDDQSVATSNT